MRTKLLLIFLAAIVGLRAARLWGKSETGRIVDSARPKTR